jgi:Zn-dependent protease with chaperone function
MAMDFFHHQDAARAASRRLVALMVVAIGIMLFLVNWLASVAIAVNDALPSSRHHHHAPAHLHLIVTVGTLLIIGLAMWWKHRELAGGGPALALQLGGREVLSTTADAAERRLRNVVEEMAISAGIPVPAVFVLDSLGINAFAAGHNLRDSALAVTRGCLTHLDRDELQAVVAHETSHLLNGDARLNLRLISTVHGLVSISHAGRLLLESFGRSRGSSHSRLALIGIGLALMVIGSLGWLLGELVRAAVSRQREFLADASAVQFTRNGAAVANALKKALRPGVGTLVNHPQTSLAKHLYFATATTGFSQWLASHPPLRERILRIDPTWDGSLLVLPSTRQAPVAEAATPPAVRSRPAILATALPAQVDFAAELLRQLPDVLAVATGEAYSARAAVLVTLLASDAQRCRAQLMHIGKVDATLATLVLRLQPAWQSLVAETARLPVLQLALPNLRRLTADQRGTWLELVSATTRLGEPTTRLLGHLIQSYFISQRPPPDFHSFAPLLTDLATALGVIAQASGEPAVAFAAGWARLEIAGPPPGLPPDGDVDALSTALGRLNRANGAIRRRIVDAIAHTIAADGRVSAQEAELLRLSCTSLGTPLPLFRDFLQT